MLRRDTKPKKPQAVSEDSSDEMLMTLIASGSESAFSILYKRHSSAIIAYCSRTLNGDVALAADIADEAFFEVWKSAGKFRAKSKPLTWIHSIARNKLVDYLRKNADSKLDKDQLKIALEGNQKPIDVAHADHSLFESVVRFMDKLSSEHKEIITLAYFEELSVKEIAEKLGISENTVKTRMFYARKRMKKILCRAGIDGEDYGSS